jgi:hypothetical protein
VIKAVGVPDGSSFKGYADFTLQELVIRTETILYRAEKWLTPEGRLITGKLPPEASGGHFGSTLRGFVLYQYYHAQVTEPLILEELHEWGVSISSGQLHRLITEGKEQFHLEKDEILRIGLQVSKHIHVDDTGARIRDLCQQSQYVTTPSRQGTLLTFGSAASAAAMVTNSATFA